MRATQLLPVFDLGGTWFRSALYQPTGEITDVCRRPAISFRSHRDASVDELQSKLADFVINEVTRRGLHRFSAASIAIGAVVDGGNGHVLGSGPLWGSRSRPLDLRAVLSSRLGRIDWHVVNDVSASLLAYAESDDVTGCARVALTTVSTGIAMRTLDVQARRIPVSPVHGVQGEIGHVPVHFYFGEQGLSLRCDCGGRNHLNAFASGSGIVQVLQTLAKLNLAPADMPKDETDLTGWFALQVRDGDPFATDVLDSTTRPLAEIIRLAFTVDAELDRMFMCGGVVESLGPAYRSSLLRCLESSGLYAVTDREPAFFQRRLRFGSLDDSAGLIGAGLHFARREG